MNLNLDEDLYSHILGGLYGQALGNAWAMPAYPRPGQTWDHFNGWLETLVDAPADHPFHAGLTAGQVTDDTEQALALAQAIIMHGQITVENTAQALLDWYNQLPADTAIMAGSGTYQALTQLKAGVAPQQSGIKGHTNGGAMHISSIGLIHPGNPEAAIRDAVTACTPTHFTDIAISGACAVAAAIAEALRPNTTLEDIISMAVWAAEQGLKYGTPWMGPSVAKRIDFAVQLASDVKLAEYDRLQNLYDFIGSTLATADAVPCAFGILVMADGNPIDTAVYAAALSGNADTVGAMAGAIAGAWQGIQAIPQIHLDLLQAANPQYDFEVIAQGLHTLALQNTEAAGMPLKTATLDSILNQE